MRAILSAFSGAALVLVAMWLSGGRFGAPVGMGVGVATGASATREFTLTAQEVDWELFPGQMVRAWTYNGSMPGPEIRVREGDLVRVTLRNELPVPTAVHWHGVDVPNNMDGVPGLTQEAVPPGGTFTYEFLATNPGTRWYHSHQDAEIQGHLGLYGALIIEPSTPPPGEPKYDREYTYTLTEWSLALTPQVATGEASLPLTGRGAPHSKQMDFDYFLMNGKAHTSIPGVLLKKGERVRIRLINAGSLVHTIHTHGHSFKIVATDGNPVPPAAQLTKDSVTLGPSERTDIELHATNPGVWMFHCHMEHHMANGMMTTIRYEGAQPAVFESTMAHGAHAGHGSQNVHAAHAPTVTGTARGAAPPAPASVAPSGTGQAGHAGGHAGHTGAVAAPATSGAASGGEVKALLVDNRFQPGALTVKTGTTLTWVNNGANVHTVSSFDGAIESAAIQPGESWSYTFGAPGDYRFFCRQHLLNGMATTVTVQ